MQLDVSREEKEVSVVAGADGVSGWRCEDETGRKGLRSILFRVHSLLVVTAECVVRWGRLGLFRF